MAGSFVPVKELHKELRYLAGENLNVVIHYAHRAMRERRRAEAAENALNDRPDSEREFLEKGVLQQVGYIFLQFWLVAAYVIDFVFLAAVAEYFANMATIGRSFFSAVARFLIPVCILVFEIGVGVFRAFASRSYRHERQSRASYYFWTAVALALSIAGIPALFLALYEVSNIGLGPSISRPLRVGLLTLALAVHISVLWGGDILLEAFGYLRLRLKMTKFERRRDRARRREDRFTQNAVRAFRSYMVHRTDYSAAANRGELEFGPFDQTTRAVINQAFAYEMIPERLDPKSDRPTVVN